MTLKRRLLDAVKPSGAPIPSGLLRPDVLSLLGHRALHERYQEDEPHGQDGEQPELVEVGQRSRLLLAEVEALPEDFRRVVMLYYYEDLTYRDLAQLLGVSTATINARLTKARALLRERLSSCRR